MLIHPRFFAAVGAVLAIGCGEAETPLGQAPPTAPEPTCRIQSDGRTAIDIWLERNGLNLYGDPPGTHYSGGSPLLDEVTGERWDRYEYVLARHPEVCDGLAPRFRPRERAWFEVVRGLAGLDEVGRRVTESGAASGLRASPLVEAGMLVDRAVLLERRIGTRDIDSLRDALAAALRIRRGP